MSKEELYKIALSNVHKYSLLNELFAIRDERFPKEQQDNMLCVNGYIGIDTLNRYVRYIDELVGYQNIGTIKNLKEQSKEIDRLNNNINEFNRIYYKIITKCEEMINNRFYMNENAIYSYANEIKGMCKYYIGEARQYDLDELK